MWKYPKHKRNVDIGLLRQSQIDQSRCGCFLLVLVSVVAPKGGQKHDVKCLYTLDISRWYITRCSAQHSISDCKASVTIPLERYTFLVCTGELWMYFVHYFRKSDREISGAHCLNPHNDIDPEANTIKHMSHRETWLDVWAMARCMSHVIFKDGILKLKWHIYSSNNIIGIMYCVPYF